MILRDGDLRDTNRAERSGYAVFMLLLAAAVAALVQANAAADRRQMDADVAEAKAWTFAAPACASLSRQAYLGNARKTHVRVFRTFAFGGVQFGRGYGDASCAMIHDDGGRGSGTFPVCQFSSPGVLEIATPRGAVYFFPSTGPATVSVPRGQPHCVWGGTFRD